MFPTIAWQIGLAEVAAAVVMFVVGYASHEGAHIGAAELVGEEYAVRVAPDGLRAALTTGTGIEVQLQSMPARWKVVAVMLAPTVAAVPPLAGYAVALSYPVLDAGVALVLAAWFIAAMPGLHDWLTVLTYRPTESVPTEVTTDS